MRSRAALRVAALFVIAAASACSAGFEPVTADAVAVQGELDAKWDAASKTFVLTNLSAARIEIRNELFIDQQERGGGWLGYTSHRVLRLFEHPDSPTPHLFRSIRRPRRARRRKRPSRCSVRA